ncbi:MAG TPA: hypothetical protein VH539_12175 [Gemmatimonadaceae bacterium]
MATVTRDPNGVWVDASTAMPGNQITGLIAGADIGAGMPCYVKAADGLVYQSDGAAATEAAKFDGFSARAAKAGQPITLYQAGVRYHYTASSGLTPGADLYLDTGGGLNTAAQTGHPLPIARAIDDTDIRITVNS